ncbi:uncharacterized protein LOC108905546 [Anoplophora glabripennis]|uniref:uncharacterized protein LOC108905546 n=1 Tax=Anoplophora glabripennis TaxID=217634 RepID=UPI000873D865|nr:uncharacterized protein LOC108905546 [Anoplophora glabripennis]
MDEEEDVKKMIEFIKLSQENTTQDFQYDDFINYENNSDVEENEETIYFDNNYDLCNFTSTDVSKLNSYDPRSTLKPEELLVIDSCSDPELKKLLLLNRTKNFQLMHLYKKLKDLLIQCQKDITEKREVINNFLKANKEQGHSTGAWRLAAPYFKDKKLYACPPNADTLRKQKNKELNVYDITVVLKWTSLECEKLLRAVKLNYNINQQNDVVKKIATLRQSKDEGEPEGIEKLKELESRLEELRNEDNSEIPPLNSDQYIDWLRVAEVFLQDRKTPFECKSFWHIYLHPHINKSPWTPEENTKLKQLAKKYKRQNWDKIAKVLGNNRTGFTTCMNYFSNLHKRFKKGDFTTEEDSRLVQLVHRHRMGNYIPWVKIVQHFKKRTRAQLHHRYTYYLTQNDKKKGKFTDAEDILLMILVDRFGKNFKKCSEYLPTRSMVQIKARYNSNLQQKLKKGSFTKKDDEIIMKYAEENGQKSWSELTKILQRCRGQIRQRYNTIKAYLNKNPNSTLDAVPRRKHHLAEVGDSFNFLRMVADQFAESPNIPTLSAIEKILRNHHQENPDNAPHTTGNLNVFTNPVSIDDMLTNFFCNSFKVNLTKCISSAYVNKAAKDVQAVLGTLNANIDIPQNFDEDLRLDNLDVAILNILADNAGSKKSVKKDIWELLPPNLNSLVGLRSLLIKYYTNKSTDEDTDDVVNEERNRYFDINTRCDIMTHLLTLSNETRTKVENERRLFYKRFHALFKWPATMTLVNPSPNLQGMSTSNSISTQFQVKRTYSKVNRTMVTEGPSKQIKISEMPSSSTKAIPLKLTPVTNKSVLADLIQNKNKKLFSMQAVKCGGATKMVIKEVNIRPTNDKELKGRNSDVNHTQTRSSVNDKLIDSAATMNGPSSKRRKLSEFVSEHEECIMLTSDEEEEEEDYVSSSDESNGTVKDDLQDLNRLEAFLKEHQSKDMPKNDDDLEDLRKLENFLKEQEEEG